MAFMHGVVEFKTRVNRKFLKAKGQKVAVRIIQQGTVALGKKRKINTTLSVQNGLMHDRGWGTMDLGRSQPHDHRAEVAARLIVEGICRSIDGAHRFISAKINEARSGSRFAIAWCGVFDVAWQ